ncbi:MAG: beta-lactamase family protein [Fervidobacterium sp.]|nr:beta-lactamase family protein [Fervidobacterium sp.]
MPGLLSETSISNVSRIIESGICQKIYPGAVLLVGFNEDILYEKNYGTLDEVEPVKQDTLYDLASLTKVIATTTAIMKLFEEGNISLNDMVGDFLEVTQEKGQITIFELLTHTSGLQPYSNLWRIFRGDELKKELLNIQPTCRGKMQYSCLNFITLMAIVEKITGKSFDEYIHQLIGIDDLRFNPQVERCAPTSERDGKRLKGLPDDELAYYLRGVSGNAGLFGTARAIHKFVARLYNEYYVSKNVMNLFTQTIVCDPSDPSNKRHIGWMAPVKGGSSGDFGNDSMFGHTGFTGTSLWCTREGLHVIFLTNKGFYQRWEDKIQRIRRLIHNVIFSQLLDLK